MDLLILGGTGFLGRHLVEAALADGHRITLFNRGLSSPDLFPEVETIEGDREADISALRGRGWDAVIDTCGYVPRIVGASAARLADAADHYTFVSSISVYPDDIEPGADEGAPVEELADPTVEDVDGETYGGLKALCERAAEEEMPGMVLNVRPGLICGPYDPTDRFTYWPRRISAGGEVLAPDRPERRVQFIDVRDLAAWIVEMSAEQISARVGDDRGCARVGQHESSGCGAVCRAHPREGAGVASGLARCQPVRTLQGTG
jgi:2'-hydroxyisoflavone reductase